MTSTSLPHNEQAEASLLGGLMFSPDQVADTMSLLDVEDFWKPSNGHVYQAIIDTFIAGDNPEAIVVAELLKSRGMLEIVGGANGVVALLNQAGAPSGIPKLAEIIHGHALMRRLISTGLEVRELGQSAPEDPNDAVRAAEELVLGVADNKLGDTMMPIHDVVDESLDRLDELLKSDGDIIGIRTSSNGLDKLTSGLRPDQFVVLAARPSMGKTAFAINMAYQAAVRDGRPVMFFSLEMGRDELLQRLIAAEGLVPGMALKNGNMKEDHWRRTREVIKLIEDAPLWIDDDPSVTINDIRAKARKFKTQHGDLALVIVDYLQLMQGRRGAESRQVEVSEISRGFKILSKNLSCPVVALSQLSRQLESRMDKRPGLADLRESGSIEQDADVVVFLYRDEVYVPDSEMANTAEIIVGKQRSGPTGTVRMGWLDKYTKFINLSEG